jgi:hypothetical protein
MSTLLAGQSIEPAAAQSPPDSHAVCSPFTVLAGITETVGDHTHEYLDGAESSLNADSTHWCPSVTELECAAVQKEPVIAAASAGAGSASTAVRLAQLDTAAALSLYERIMLRGDPPQKKVL